MTTDVVRNRLATATLTAGLALVLLVAGVVGLPAGAGSAGPPPPSSASVASVSAGGGQHPPITLPRGWRQRFDTDDRTVGLLRASVAAARADRPVPSRLRPSLRAVGKSLGELGRCNYAKDSVRRLCLRGDRRGERTLVVLGNSHARHWIDAFEALARRNGYRAYYLAKPQCLAALVTPDQRDGSPYRGCATFQRFALRSIARLEPDLVVVSSSGTRGTVYVDGEHVTRPSAVRRAIFRGHLDLFRRLRASADRVALLEDVPELSADPSACLRRGGDLRSCLGRVAPSTVAEVRDQLRAARRGRVPVVTTRQWFCWEGDCPAVVGGYLPYRDGEHIPNPYSRSLAGSLATRLRIR